MSPADLILLVLLVAAVVAWLLLPDGIPEGYEDETGFHYGREPGSDR